MRNRTAMSGRLRMACALGLQAAIVVLSLIPGTPQPGDTEFVWLVAGVPSSVQNAMHLVLYGLLVVLWLWTRAAGGALTWRASLTVAVTVTVFGATLEALQLLVPGRYASLQDVALNSAGALLGAMLGRRALAVTRT